MRLGFGGVYKLGCWTPVEVTLRGGDVPVQGWVELELPDGDGARSLTRTPADRPVQLRPGQQTTTQLYARFGQADASLTVRFVASDDRKVKARREFGGFGGGDDDSIPPPQESDDDLIVVLGPPLGLEDGEQLFSVEARERIEIANLDGDEAVAQLPTRWYGYEGVDVLVLGTTRPDIYRLLDGNERIDALEEWINLGGRLILCVGREGPAVLSPAGEPHPLARFAPGRFETVVPLRQGTALEVFAESTDSLLPPGQADAAINVAKLIDVTGRVEVRESDVPLVIRSPHGLGEVLFVCTDLNAKPLSQWPGRGRFINKLLGMSPSAVNVEADQQYSVGNSGLTDLSGQLRGALDQFSGVKPVPFVIVALLVAVYVALIGPGDYFFVKKILKRMELTWITFPAIVLVFSVGAYVLAYWLKGDQLVLNQVDLLDVDVETETVRGTSWMKVFSPRMEPYDLSYRPQLPDGEPPEESEQIVSWLGLPGGALGGMSSRASGGGLGGRPYEFTADLDQMLGVPIQVWSSKAFTARWTADTDLDLDYELQRVSGGELVGSVTNTFDVSLDNCLLAYDRWAWTLGTMEPGQTVTIGPGVERSELQTKLTGRRLEMDSGNKQFKQYTDPYDFAGFDVPLILRQMMFYEAAGGRDYAQLRNDYQGFVDLSRLLRAGRAILIGFSPRPSGDLLRDGEPLAPPSAAGEPDRNRHWSCYRFVFPVEAEEEEEAAIEPAAGIPAEVTPAEVTPAVDEPAVEEPAVEEPAIEAPSPGEE